MGKNKRNIISIYSGKYKYLRVAYISVIFVFLFGLSIGLSSFDAGNYYKISILHAPKINSESGKKVSSPIPIIEKRKSLGTHFSYFNKKKFSEDAFSAIEELQTKPAGRIYGMVVNHHLLANEMIAQVFKYIESRKAKTVVMIGPNHFMRGNGKILVSQYDWKTPYGILEADLEIIDKLKKSGLLKADERVFQEEHAITGLVAFVKRVLPKAKFVPIIIKDNLSGVASYQFAQKLDEILPDDALVIGSFDFSHTLPKLAADFHDEKSMAVLDSLDYSAVSTLDIDSKPGLKVVLKYFKLRNAKNFQLVNHANATMILNKPNMEDVTSYITGYWTSGKENKNEKVTMLAVGDMMLDRYVRQVLKKRGNNYPFKYFERFLSGQDFTYTNFEGPVTDFNPKALHPNNLIFTFNPDILPTLKKLKFNLFGLGNNHTWNFGKDGFAQTLTNLDKYNFDYFGNPKNEDKISLVREIRGLRFAFIGYSELYTNNFDQVIKKVEALNNADDRVDFIVVFPHFGIEYRLNFSKYQQEKAHQLIDAGADLIIGTHPHVIQPMEIYNGKMIFYSLGNFIFDQTFSVSTQQGLGVGIIFGKDEMKFYLFPHETDNFQVKLLNGNRKDEILNRIADMSEVGDMVRNEIKSGVVRISNPF